MSANWNDGVTTNTGEIIATNSTISSNGSVGVYANNGDVTLNWVTVAGNSERGAGVGNSGLMIFTGVLLAGNDGGDCNTGVEADSYSLDTDGSCGLGLTSVSNGVANLGPLQNNGGTTETHDLMAGSDAIDNGGNGCPEDDQRYFARGVGPACDIGAVELQGTPATATATATPCDGECPTETATSVTIKTHTPTATATAAATNTPMLASTNTPAAAATATPQGGQGGAVRGPTRAAAVETRAAATGCSG